jgi:hypothetical protein
MSGIPGYNGDAFKNACFFILKECARLPVLEVVSPLDVADTVFAQFKELHIDREPAWEDFMKADIRALIASSCVYFLPGWEKSRGATVEHFIAHNLGIPCVKTKPDLRILVKNILKENNGGN